MNRLMMIRCDSRIGIPSEANGYKVSCLKGGKDS
jgi:hypothetical protein